MQGDRNPLNPANLHQEEKATIELHENGNLTVPEGELEKLFNGEPAILMQVKRNIFQRLTQTTLKRFLLQNAPKSTKQKYKFDVNGNKILHTEDGSEISILESFDDPNTQHEVLARPHYSFIETRKLSEDPNVLEVATFMRKTKIVAGRRDIGKEVAIQKTGYMFKKDVEESSQSYKPYRGQLFTKLPEASDIHQASMGNCYLLSVIGAILKMDDGQAYIMNMMKLSDDGKSVIVRLFDPSYPDGHAEPIYVRVEYSYLCENGESTVYHKAPWVHILEKAYAGFGRRALFAENSQQKMELQGEAAPKSELKAEHDFPSFATAYGGGGFSQFAMKILTGKTATYNKISKVEDNFPLDGSEINTIIAIGKAYKGNEENKQNAIKTFNESKGILEKTIKLLGDNIEVLAAFGNYLHQNKLYGIADKIPQNKKELASLVSKLKAPFVKMTNPDDHLKSAITILEDKLNALENRFPGHLGSFIYTDEQIKLYNELETLIKRGSFITADTPSFFNEGKVAGLFTDHTYTVSHVYPKKMPGNKEQLCVRVRNPWGSHGRAYDTIVEKKKGEIILHYEPSEQEGITEFDLDITDFMQHFEAYQSAELPTKNPQIEQEKREKELLSLKQNQDERDKKIILDKLDKKINKWDFNLFTASYNCKRKILSDLKESIENANGETFGEIISRWKEDLHEYKYYQEGKKRPLQQHKRNISIIEAHRNIFFSRERKDKISATHKLLSELEFKYSDVRLTKK